MYSALLRLSTKIRFIHFDIYLYLLSPKFLGRLTTICETFRLCSCFFRSMYKIICALHSRQEVDGHLTSSDIYISLVDIYLTPALHRQHERG